MPYFKYGATTFTLRTVCLFLSGGSLGSVDALLTPMEWATWLATIAFAAAVLLLHKYFSAVEGAPVDWSDGLISVFGTFTGQGFGSSGEWASGRILLLVSEVLFMLIDGYYGSAIVKFLLRPPAPSVHSGDDLANSDYFVALHEWWLLVREFEIAPEGTALQKLWVRKVAPPRGPGVFTTNRLADFLIQPLHAIIGSQEIVYKATAFLDEDQACRVHELDLAPLIHVGPLYGKHVGYTEAFHAGVLIQRERGVQQRVNSKWQQQRTECGGDGSHGAGDPIGLEPVLPLLGVLLLGIVLALAVAVAERAVA
ncbi:hypothetical protein ONE63_005036 [Megalurothrips usitatus]|uniref:Uncharacterized protein n=1 Tax=Megalurothrips usitatus TaxID=439358 RepID=A0AAV7X550_9NEOP|nr:hypothetical protein ONE63_005036 [Megalurothrips usitatus]